MGRPGISIAAALGGLALAAFGLHHALRGLDWHSFAAQVSGLDWRWLALAVVFDVASYVAQGARWRALLEGAKLWQTTRAIYAGLLINELIPLRPGEGVRAWIAARDLRIGLRRVAPTMVAERIIDAGWLALALLTALCVAPLPPSLVRAVWIVTGLAALLIAAVWLLRGSGFPEAGVVASGLRNRRAVAISAVFLAAQGLAFWSVMRASHLSLNVLAAFVVMLVVRVGTMIPGAPANLGTHQFATVLGLSLYGVPQVQAAGFSLVVFTVLTLPLCLGGLGAVFSAGLPWRELRALNPAIVSRS